MVDKNTNLPLFLIDVGNGRQTKLTLDRESVNF